MRIAGKKIGILLESDYLEPEIAHYAACFPAAGAELHFLTRLWGQPSLRFTGRESRRHHFEVRESFEGMSPAELRTFAALIVPAGMVADHLRYTEDTSRPPPATLFLERAFAEKTIYKALLCHALYLVEPAPHLVQGRRLTTHDNLIAQARQMGATYLDQDLVVDDDLITARTGRHCPQLTSALIDRLAA
jgi:protease I